MSAYIIYARKSSESEDRQALSIEAQVKELTEHAAKNNLPIRKVYTEAKSAKSSGRPVFAQMLEDIRRSHVAGIVCWKLDRLTRNLLDAAMISDALESGVITEIRTPFQTYRNNSGDKFMTHLDFIMAKKYIDDLSENVKRGLKAKAQSGWMPGRAPLGYLNVQALGKGFKTIVKDPDRFALMRKMWNLMLTGNHSVARILAIANNEWGFKTKVARASPSKPLSRSMAYEVFTNPFYCGQFVYGGELHDGHHEAMVTREEFDVVQNLLGRPGRERPKRHRFAFTGLIRCGECGAMVTAEEKYKLIKSTGARRRYVYYHCTHHKDPGCRQRSITEEGLKAQVVLFLDRITIPESYLEWVFKYMDSIRSKERHGSDEITAGARKELNSVQRRLENLIAMKISPENSGGALLSNGEYLLQKNRLVAEKSRLEEQLKNATDVTGAVERLTRETFRFATYARIWFSQGESERQRTILSAIGSNHSLINGILQFQPAKPLIVLQGAGLGNTYESDRLEPSKFGSERTQSAPHRDGFCADLRQVDDVRTAIKGEMRTGMTLAYASFRV